MTSMSELFSPGPMRDKRVVGSARDVLAVLGPTNTGKTHFAIERMLSHKAGMIGLPLRLLAREVYNRVVAKVGPEAVALITGEEKIKPKHPLYWVSTVEAMPRDLDLPFVAIDEIQLAANFDRGHVFTDRILNRRGTRGNPADRRGYHARGAGAPAAGRARQFAAAPVAARLRRRPQDRAPAAGAAPSSPSRAEDVYAIAEWIRRQRGGAAVVLGALCPRTRNAQIDLYQNGDVDYIVATDAIGMGLNLDVDHVAFASDRKFDGYQSPPAQPGRIRPDRRPRRPPHPRRHLRHHRPLPAVRRGTGGDDRIPRLRSRHAVAMAQRRAGFFQHRIPDRLARRGLPDRPGLTRAPVAEDQVALEAASRDESVRRNAKTRADIERLWDVCQIPDYRKTSPAAHADLVLAVYGFIVRAGRIPDDWFARQIASVDRTDGDIDALSARISQVRTCAFIANRNDWLNDPEHWQGVARQVEDSLSDALHARLTQRFVDRRASVLMRRLRENTMLEAEVTPTGQVMVEGHHVGSLQGFCFTPDPQAEGEEARDLERRRAKSAGDRDRGAGAPRARGGRRSLRPRQ